MRTARVAQLFGGCVVLGLGVSLLLEAALGSDGYSTLVNGVTLATGWPFWIVNLLVSGLFVAMAWTRGTVPGPGTVVQMIVVGVTVSVAMTAIPDASDLLVRVGELALALVLLVVGVATYLATDTGAGPAEAAAIAWDPPVPFRWSYSMVQGGGALVGWMLGGAVGVGTLLVIVLLGPAVVLFRRLLPRLEHGVRTHA